MDVVSDLDRLIERGSRRDPTPDDLEPSYAESVRRYHARRRKEIAAAWFAAILQKCANHARIAQDYERRAEELCKEG